MLTHAFHLLNEICNVNSAFSESQKIPYTFTSPHIHNHHNLNPVEIPSFRQKKELPLPLYAINSPRLPIHPTPSDEINRGHGANNRRKFNPSPRKKNLPPTPRLVPLAGNDLGNGERAKPNRNFDMSTMDRRWE